MKIILKYFGIFLLVLFSFYCTEKTATFVRSKDPIMESIKEFSEGMNVEAVDALIEEDYIIPGMVGIKVDEMKSLMKMKEQDVFNSLLLVTKEVKPSVSLENNKDKIIRQGNSKKGGVAFLLANKENLIQYFRKNKLKASFLVDNDTYNDTTYLEPINNDFNNYYSVEKKLNKNKQNTSICIVSKENLEFCKKNNKYLVEPTYELKDSNVVEIKSKITSGDIIYVEEASTSYLDVLVKYVESKNLSILNLSELIKEN